MAIERDLESIVGDAICAAMGCGTHTYRECGKAALNVMLAIEPYLRDDVLSEGNKARLAREAELKSVGV